MQSGNMGVGAGSGHQSFHDMQRLQQQLVYRQQQQQQVGALGALGTPQAMPQQPSFPAPGLVQQHMNTTSLAALQQQQQSMNNNSALSMMQGQQQQQQLLGVGMSNPNMNQLQFNGSGGVPNTWNPSGSGLGQGLAGSTMDASSGTSARLMAIAGMGNTSGGLMSSGSAGMNLSSSFGNNIGIAGNGGLANNGPNSTSTMQNMQVLVQRQQQQQNLGKQLPVGSSNPAFSNFNTSQQQQHNALFNNSSTSLANKLQLQQQQGNMGMSGINIGMSGSNANASNVQMSANLYPLQQQQFLLQQQLAAMQKQQGRNSGLGGITGNSPMDGAQQQHAQDACNNNSLGGITSTNTTAANQNLLQQRQQQLLHQIQQGSQSQGNNTSMGMMSQFQHQQQQGAGNSGMLQQIMSNFRQQPQSDMGGKNLANGSTTNNGTSSLMFNQGPGLGNASSISRSSSATPTMFNANQDLSGNQLQQQHSQLFSAQSNNLQGNLSGASPNPIGLGLNNLTAEQRFRLHQQGLLNHHGNGSVNNSGGVFGMGNSGTTNDIGLVHGQHNDVLGELSSTLQMGQTSNHNSFSGTLGGSTGEANSGHNTPMLGAGVPSVGLSNPTMVDQANNQRSNNSNSGGSGQCSSGSTVGSTGQQQRSFLDGMFAGGWQSNKDLPDRRRIIFNILDVIRQMRPDTSKMSDKLPHMAKSLEEHLYRNAKSKEEYMDLSTLKKRLQTIAHGLEVHREGPNLTGMKHSEAAGSEPNMLLQNGNDNISLHGAFDTGSMGGDGDGNMSQQGNSTWSQLQSTNGNMNSLGVAPSSTAPMTNLGMDNGVMGSATPLMGSIQNLNQSEQGAGNNNTTQQALAQSSIAGSMHQQMQLQATRSVGQNSSWNHNGVLSASNSELPKSQLDELTNMVSNQNSIGFQQQNMTGNNPNIQLGTGLLDTSLGSTFSNNVATQNNNVSNQSNLFNTSGMSQLSQGGQNARIKSETSWGNTSELANTTSMGNGDGNSVTNQSTTDSGVQKKRVILQQQQRLLLLRHASRCTAGSNCTTKFCEQMVTLWNHMKTCRNKNCKTSHCFSSRCVLNHYRICKSNGKTASCEVCGPVMLKIKQQERDDGGNADPLAAVSSSQIPFPTLDERGTTEDVLSSNQQSGISGQADTEDSGKNQQKMKAQLLNLRLLHRKQEELQKQQQRLDEQLQNVPDPNSQQAQQLQQQQMLLQQLRKRCQQQQTVLQQSIQKQQSSLSNEAETEPIPTPPIDQPNDQAQEEAEEEEENDDNSNTVQIVKPRGSINEGKGKRIASKGKRVGKYLGKTRPEKEKDDESGKKRRASVAITPKERAQKRGKLASKQAAMAQRENDSSSQTGNDGNNGEDGDGDANSVVSNMSKDEIQKHLDSLNKKTLLSSRTITYKCMPLLQELLNNPFGWVFREAVDPVALGLPDYFDVVKNPMHLELVKNKLENAIYSDIEQFAHDTKLVFENAILYNGKSSDVGELAQSMLNSFDKSFSALVQVIESSYLKLESQGDLCPLCGLQKRQFEPTVLYCQGRCGMQRIKPDATYFTDHSKQNHWCESCYSSTKTTELLDLDDGTKVGKKDLQEFKNDALAEEAWVNCDECSSWVHQICGLFNGRTNNSNAKYTCPRCYVLRAPDVVTRKNSRIGIKGARELPHCKMSEFIEKGLQEALESAYVARANELKVSYDEIEKADGLSVRVVSNIEKKHVVGEKMLNRYKNANCAREFPARTKCISLFQKIHGVDTILFAVYVYEYGHECPTPNRRRVYISYLDSAQYFSPKCFRTTAYHAILIEYLRYVKHRGFHTAHIWSCPPTPGDDFIFYCHPKHQLVPREDMLRAWYHKMLDQAKAQGVVIKTSNLYDDYFSDSVSNFLSGNRQLPTCLPYFEGDYIPGEIENIISFLENNPGKGRPTSAQDEVMKRIGSNLVKMKENFIVVHLRSRGFAAAVERGEDVSNWKEDSDDEMVRSKRARLGGKSSLAHSIKRSGKDFEASCGKPCQIEFSSTTKDHGITVKDELTESESGRSSSNTRSRRPSLSSIHTRSKSRSVKADIDDKITVVKSHDAEALLHVSLEGNEGTCTIKNGDLSELASIISSHFEGHQRRNVPIGDTSDDDAPVESEIFESRQQFLNYCQTNNCQFDELRRAKHSSIILLFQLHNPMAPRFLQQCGACYRDITHGTRYHCKMCANFDLCQDCYKPVISGEWARRDPRFAHDMSHAFHAVDMEAQGDTIKSREEREKYLKAHIELLEHASKCIGLPSCTLVNCQRLKKIICHVVNCDTTPKRDCKICTRMLSLSTVHSRGCKSSSSCLVPFCDRLRERCLRLRQQQQLMDDRRRNAQNDLYRAAAGRS